MPICRRRSARRGRDPPPISGPRSGSCESAVKIVALVVDDNKGREIDDLDPPDRLHPELGIFDRFDLLDAVLREARRRPADRAKIEAAVFLAGVAHLGAAVAL